jgi:hypothetical protein
LIFCFVMGVVAHGCGGSSGSKYTGAAAAFAACGWPACYLDLIAPCLPDGACVAQTTEMCGASACPTTPTTTSTGEKITVCFENGAKTLIDFDTSNPAGDTVTETDKIGSTMCLTSSEVVTYPILTSTEKNAAGTTVATVVQDETAQTLTITCEGGSPTVVPLYCGARYDTGSCKPGICTW